MMMLLLRFTIIVVIFGVVTSKNHDVNLQAPYGEMSRKRSVEATTLIPPDPKIHNEETRQLLTRLENLCIEKLEFLITDTNGRFESLENKLSRGSLCPAPPVFQNNENLESKVDNLEKQFLENIQELMNATRNLRSDVQEIKQNVTKIVVDTSSNLVSKQIFNKGLQELKDLQIARSTSCPINITLNKHYPRNCKEVQESGKTASGTYTIQPESALRSFEVLCDLETRGGGWTVIQKRFDGSQDFFLYWEDYKNGFGNLGGEFWLGLKNIHLLTGFEVNELLIEMGDFESQNRSALYTQFTIGSEIEGYSLKVLGAYSGDAGDSLTYQIGKKFSTKDNDQDDYVVDCAHYHSGAWWYHNCAYSNLNGKYFDRGEVPNGETAYSIFWVTFKQVLKHTRMLVRPKV